MDCNIKDLYIALLSSENCFSAVIHNDLPQKLLVERFIISSEIVTLVKNIFAIQNTNLKHISSEYRADCAIMKMKSLFLK